MAVYGVRHVEIYGKDLPEPFVGVYPIYGPIGHFSFEHLRGPLPEADELIKPLLDLNQEVEV